MIRNVWATELGGIRESVEQARGDVTDKKMRMKKVNIGDVDKEELFKGEVCLSMKTWEKIAKGDFSK